LLRLLSPQYGGCEQYRSRLSTIAEKIPASLDRLRTALEKRIREDGEAIAITTRDAQSGQRFARKLLDRLSRTLAFALLCEAAAASGGDQRQAHSAWRYFEQIEPPSFGTEDQSARRELLAGLQDESVTIARSER